MIKVIVNGAKGKMGALACEALANDARFKMVGALTKTDDLARCIQDTKAEVVVDLTRADVVYRNAKIIVDAGVHPVIGASGLNEAQITELTAACKKQQLGGLIVPNFSIGVLLMMHFSKQAAQYFKDVEIVEMHHIQKIDAPSATAIKTASVIASRSCERSAAESREAGSDPSRGHLFSGIPIHSIRLPGVLAKQSVIFGGLGEQLVITHESMDRQCFMPGLLLACERVMGLHEMKYGLENVIDSLQD